MQTQYALHGNAGLRVDCLGATGTATVLPALLNPGASPVSATAFVRPALVLDLHALSDQVVEENNDAQGQEHR